VKMKTETNHGAFYDSSKGYTEMANSNIHCSALGHCEVNTYGTLAAEFSLPRDIYHHFPFDIHEFSFEFSWSNPYMGYLNTVVLDEWGVTNESNYLLQYSSTTDSMTAESLEFSLSQSLKINKFDFEYEKQYESGIWTQTLKLKRLSNKFVERFVFPLIVIVLIATSMPWLPSAKAGPRNQVCVIAMLTAVAFGNAASGTMPVSNDLTWFDHLNIAAIVWPFIVILENLLVVTMDQKGMTKMGLKIDQVARGFFPCSFGIFVFSSMNIHITGNDAMMIPTVVVILIFIGTNSYLFWLWFLKKKTTHPAEEEPEAQPQRGAHSLSMLLQSVSELTAQIAIALTGSTLVTAGTDISTGVAMTEPTEDTGSKALFKAETPQVFSWSCMPSEDATNENPRMPKHTVS